MFAFIRNLIQRYFYVSAVAAFILFFVLGIDSSKPGSVTDLKTTDLLQGLQEWQKNAAEIKNYLTDINSEIDSVNKKYQQYNFHSDLNNKLLQKNLNTAQNLNDKTIYNELAKISKDYAVFFEQAKNKIEKKSAGSLQTKLDLKKQFQVLEYKTQVIYDTLHKKSNQLHLNLRTTYFTLSLLSLMSAALHLFYLLRLGQKTIWNLTNELDTFKKALENVSEGVVVTNRYGFFTYINDSARKILGPAVNDIYYPSSIDVMGFHDLSGRKLMKEEIPMHTGLHRHVVLDQEILIKNSQHEQGLIVSSSNGYFIDGQGQTAGSVVVLKNITAKKQIEELWKTERERALKNSQLKSDFLASMSHEIRTPMNGVLGLTDLLKRTQLDEDQKDYVLIIQRSAKALLNLINDILDHSKIEAGKLDIQMKPFSLTKLVKEVCDNFKPLVLEKNIKLITDLTELDHDDYVSDPHRLRQILMNLVGNALKFTQQGFVQIKVHYNHLQGLKFSIQDTGPGMTEHEVSHLFQKYFQTKNGQIVGGTGLGLSICHQLTKLLKGEIGVSSKLNQGSEFWFTIPCDQAINYHYDQQESEKTDLYSDDQKSAFLQKYSGLVLVAEDNSINQKVIVNYLSQLGLQSLVAENGQQAIELYQQKKPNLILMDSNMPLMSGLDATKNIISLQQTEPLPHCSIVMLSADVRPETIDESLKSGAKDFLSKPIDIDELISILKKYLLIDQKIMNKQVSHIDKIKDLIIGDQLLIEVLLNDFKQQTNLGFKSMKKFLDQANYQEIYHISHSLKSAAAELDAFSYSQIMQKIEDLSISFLDKNSPILSEDYKILSQILQQSDHILKKELSDIESRIQSIKDSKRQAS